MNSHDEKVLKKIIEHAEHVVSYTSECKGVDDFSENTLIVEACVFNIMQIGELAKTALGDEAKATITTIPWKDIYGMRNRIVHGYSDVSLDVVWDTAKNDIPPMIDELRYYLYKTR